MLSRQPLPLQALFALLLVGSLALLARDAAYSSQLLYQATSTQGALTALPIATSTAEIQTAPEPEEAVSPEATPVAIEENVPQQSQGNASSEQEGVVRVENPYSTSPLSFDEINTVSRAALVNIFCVPQGGSLRPISGSGILVNPRGVILTNAHVAQYVLLSQDPRVNLSCFVRTGSPAAIHFKAHVLYIPSSWVHAHAQDINNPHPTGTGEHDYALLFITGPENGSTLPSSFPYLEPDVREAISFIGDSVLVASYPAELAGGSVQSNLFPVSSITQVAKFFTFEVGTPDVFSVGGVIGAQGGSSGGGVVNAWRRLVGVLTTTSDAATTAERDLRAISLFYIDTDLRAQTGQGLAEWLAKDPVIATADFSQNKLPALIQSYLDILLK